jgi:hypothetical protein
MMLLRFGARPKLCDQGKESDKTPPLNPACRFGPEKAASGDFLGQPCCKSAWLEFVPMKLVKSAPPI